MVMERGRLSILSCESGKPFATRMVKHLNALLQDNGDQQESCLRESKETFFANKEVKTVINHNIRGDDVYIVQCVDDPLLRPEHSVNDNLFALFTAIDAAYNSDAETITAVIPQFPYARQERKKGREAISARQVVTFLEAAGANRVITLDIHAEAIEGFFRVCKLENLHASRSIIQHLKENYDIPNMTVVGPDVGSIERARFYSRELKTDLAVVDKVRDYSKPSTIESVRLIGDVRGKNVLLVDDMIATGGTLINAAQLLQDKGAQEVYFVCSLPYFNGNAAEKLDAAYQQGIIKKVIGTDAVFHGDAFARRCPWYEEVPISELFAQVIFNINHKLSVSELLR